MSCLQSLCILQRDFGDLWAFMVFGKFKRVCQSTYDLHAHVVCGEKAITPNQNLVTLLQIDVYHSSLSKQSWNDDLVKQVSLSGLTVKFDKK